MSVTQKFYTERADDARREAEATSLGNVRERHLRAAAAWDEMAARQARVTHMRAETEARKAAERVAEAALIADEVETEEEENEIVSIS